MKYMLKRGMSLAMAVIMIFTFGSQTFADTWSDNYLNKNNEYNIRKSNRNTRRIYRY